MKRVYLFLFTILITSTFRLSSQSVTLQFYHDINNNCSLDAGEPFLYNILGYGTLNYVNLSGNTVVATGSAVCGFPISVSNPSVPATNTFSFTDYYSSTTYPTFSINTACSSYTNLSYTGINYLPVRNVSPMTYVAYYTNTTGTFNSSTTSSFPVCNNLVNDSVSFWFYYDNIYSCGASGDLTTSRTYSLFLDNILIDKAVTTGTNGNTYIVGALSKMDFSEGYYNSQTQIYVKVKLSSGPLSPGNHLFELKSTPLYTPAISVITHSITMNAVPCSAVSGNIYEDCDNNCVKTSGDGALYYGAAVNLFNATNSYVISPDYLGNFNAFVPTSPSQYSITAIAIAPNFTPCSAATATVPVVSSTGYDFGFKTNAYVDPFVYGPSIIGTTNPGSIKNMNISSINYSTYYALTCASSFPVNPGKIKVVLDKNLTYLNIVGSTPIPNSIVSCPSGDTLIWNVSNLNSSASLNYVVSVQMSSTVSIGTGYTNYAFIYPTIDMVMTNNSSVWTWSVGLPCDPNDKRSWATGIQPNGDIPLATTDLFYTINFQNIGTAPAINVKCADTLDANLDWNTLQVISSSFPVQVQTDKTTGSTFFNFNSINLPDSTSNEPGSHGYVHYRIKLKPSVPVNTVIKNRAHNYFDFQPAVATNQTKNKLVSLAGINEIEKINSVFVAPNPVSDKVTISSKEIIQSVSVFNNLGQIIFKQEINTVQSQIDLSQLTDGIYFLNIQFKDGSRVTRKVIKN